MKKLVVLLVTLASITSGCQTRVVEKQVVVTWTPSAARISERIEPADLIVGNEEPSESDCLSEISDEDTCLDLFGFWGIQPYEPGLCVDWQKIAHPYYRNVECVEGVVKAVECGTVGGGKTACVALFTNRKIDDPSHYRVSMITSRYSADQFTAAWKSLIGSCIQATGYNGARDGNIAMQVHDLDDVELCY
jgi:hypothetical protein